MKIKIDYHSGKPVYRQIVEEFVKAIGRGEFSDNDPLPSVRDLAESLSVNPNTVAKAYRELEREGYVYSRPGVGIFTKLSKEKIEKIVLLELKKRIKREIEFALSHGISKEKCRKVINTLLEEIKNERDC